MVQPIDQKTLAAIGGETTLRAATAFAQTMAQGAQVMGGLRQQKDELALAEDKFVATQKLNKQQSDMNELDMNIKRGELMGRASIGIQELIKNDPDMFPTEYAKFREQQPESVRKYLPEVGTPIAKMDEYSRMTAMQSTQGVPYLKALKTSEGQKSWQFDVAALEAVKNNTADTAQSARVEYMYALTPGTQQAPTTGQIESSIFSLQSFKVGEDNLFDLLDKDSVIGAANAIAAREKILAQTARDNRDPALMKDSKKKAIESLIQDGKLVPVESILGSERLMQVADTFLPDGWADKVSSKSMVFIENPQGFSDAADAFAQQAEQEAQGAEPVPPVDLKIDETRIVGEYLWRINPNTGEAEYKKIGN